MVINSGRILKKDKNLVTENVKQAKQYVATGALSQEDFDTIVKSVNPKYAGWVAKIWIKEKPDLDDLRNTVEEYDVFVKRGKTEKRDINMFKSFADLKAEVDELNASGAAVSNRDLENDYETIIDNEDLLVMVPHTHEASRKLGLSQFAFRNCGKGQKDSSWCVTYKAPDHFNNYYFQHNVTFYFVKVRSKRIQQELKEAFPKRTPQIFVTALALIDASDRGKGIKIDAYDGKDRQLSQAEVKKFTSIVGLS